MTCMSHRLPGLPTWRALVLASTVLLTLGGCGASPKTIQPELLFGPYKDLNMAVDPRQPVASSRVTGSLLPLVNLGTSQLIHSPAMITLAFASGECGQERWGSLDARQVASLNVPALDRAGLGYIISTGGEGGVFTCATDAGIERFIARYQSTRLLGIDFDIEASQTDEMITSLVQRAKAAQQRHPALRFSFTLATFGASDGTGASLNTTGERVLRAIRTAAMEHFVINLMVMNYGPATPASCVVRAGRCDMAASAQQAVSNLQARHGIPLRQIALTAMIGVNDVTSNVFTLQDATDLARYVREQQLAGLHYWSLDRDTPCPPGQTSVSPTCSGVDQVGGLAYYQAFLKGLR